jgi:hypothetical protein
VAVVFARPYCYSHDTIIALFAFQNDREDVTVPDADDGDDDDDGDDGDFA